MTDQTTATPDFVPVTRAVEAPDPVAYVQAESGAEVTGQIITERSELEAIGEKQNQEIGPIVAGALAMKVTNPTEEADAIEALNDIKRSLKSVEEERKKVVNPINAAKTNAQNFFNKLKSPLEEATAILKPKVIAYQEAEERRVREENAKREREAIERQQAEQKRIDAEKEEANRVAKEAAEAARKASEAMAEKPDPEAEAKALEAAEAARKAAEELAAKREERPAFEMAEREEVAATVRTANGKATRKKVWEWTLVDRSKLPDEYLIVDEKKLNAVVKAGIRDIPGVKIEQVSKLAV